MRIMTVLQEQDNSRQEPLSHCEPATQLLSCCLKKHLERGDSAVCISACTVCERVRRGGANALCVCVCVCALIRVIKLVSVNRLMLSCQQRA